MVSHAYTICRQVKLRRDEQSWCHPRHESPLRLYILPKLNGASKRRHSPKYKLVSTPP